jgi:hypothetical protein
MYRTMAVCSYDPLPYPRYSNIRGSGKELLQLFVFFVFTFFFLLYFYYKNGYHISHSLFELQLVLHPLRNAFTPVEKFKPTIVYSSYALTFLV